MTLLNLNKRRYTLSNRLSDVIRLITVLALDKWSFRKLESVEVALRGSPESLKTWKMIADAHPEFFRPNGQGDHIALLMRSYRPEDHDGQRDPLSIPETQKLIDVAISLHEKEIERIQRNSHKIPIAAAIISFIGLGLSAWLTYSTHATDFKSVETLNKKIDSLNINIQKLKPK